VTELIIIKLESQPIRMWPTNKSDLQISKIKQAREIFAEECERNVPILNMERLHTIRRHEKLVTTQVFCWALSQFGLRHPDVITSCYGIVDCKARIPEWYIKPPEHKHTSACWVKEVKTDVKEIPLDFWRDAQGNPWNITNLANITKLRKCTPTNIRVWRKCLEVIDKNSIFFVPISFSVKKTFQKILDIMNNSANILMEKHALAGWYERKYLYTRRIELAEHKHTSIPWVLPSDPRVKLMQYKTGDVIQYYTKCPVNGLDIIERRVGIAPDNPKHEETIVNISGVPKNIEYETYLSW